MEALPYYKTLRPWKVKTAKKSDQLFKKTARGFYDGRKV